MDTLNKSDFCDKRLKYRGFYRKNNLKSEYSQWIDEDLFALLEANDSATPCTCAEKCAAGEVNTECAVCRMNMKSCAGKEIVREEPAAEPEPDKSDKKSNNMLPVVFVILLIGGGAAVYFLKFRKSKPKTSGTTDLDDYDYGEEDETEYEGDEENE